MGARLALHARPLAAALALLCPLPCAAQAPIVVWAAGPTATTGRAELWARRVARALEEDGTVDLGESWAWAPPGIALGRVERLAQIERAITDAQALAARLEEGAALARLVEAETLARESVDVPGAVAWYAEVELELATLAHQLGEPALSRACLGRAAALAPDRALRAAEGPPDLVAEHEAARRAQAASPASSVRIVVPGADDALVFVDDVPAGGAPRVIEVPAGLHVLRVEAPGHVGWSGFVELAPGARPDLSIELAPSRAAALARSAHEAAEALALDEVEAALRALEAQGRAPSALVLVVAGGGVLDRAAGLVCSAAGCRAPVTLEGTEAADLGRLSERGPRTDDAVADALAWLDAPLPLEAPPPPPPPEWWTEWWPWATAGVVVVGGVAAGLGAALYEPPQPGLTVIVMPDPLSR